MEKTEKKLSTIYYDPSNPAAFSSAYKIYKQFNAENNNQRIKITDIKKWLAKQDTFTLHKPIRRKFQRLRIFASYINEQWEADLMDVRNLAKFNDGVKYILVTIDVLSKFAFALPLKEKSSHMVIDAFKKIFKKRKPEKLRTDQGREFNNKYFQSFMKAEGIKHFFATDEVIKCAIIERFNRTLRGKMFKFMHAISSKTYIHHLQSFIKAYNSSKHRSIGMKPEDVNESNFEKAYENLYGSVKTKVKEQKFKLGDLVRIQKKKDIFEKGSNTNYTEEIFVVDKIMSLPNRIVYKLKDMYGEDITSIFYEEELNRITL